VFGREKAEGGRMKNVRFFLFFFSPAASFFFSLTTLQTTNSPQPEQTSQMNGGREKAEGEIAIFFVFRQKG
jgi:hypothetical protein